MPTTAPIAENLFGTNKTGTPAGLQGARIKPAAVQSRIEAAEATLRALQLRYSPVAFLVAAGDEAAKGPLSELNAAIREAEDEVRSLTAAKTEAVRIEALSDGIARQNLWNSRAAAMHSHMSQFVKACAEISRGLEVAAVAYRKAQSSLDKAKTACPEPELLRSGVAPGVAGFNQWTGEEMFRLGGDPSISNPQHFPSSERYANSMALQNPASIQPLADRVMELAAYMAKEVKEKTPQV